MRAMIVSKPVDTADRRQTTRLAASRKMCTIVRNCREERCVLRNLSTHGACLDAAEPYLVGEKIFLELQRHEFVAARVAWVAAKSIGLAFFEAISRGTVIANLNDAERRVGGPRVDIVADASILSAIGSTPTIVCNLSQKGARIVGNAGLKRGDLLRLEFDAIGSVAAVVRWSGTGRAGLLFDQPLPLWDLMRCIKFSSRAELTLP